MICYVIRHDTTGAYMPCRMFRSNRGGWSMWIPETPVPEGWGGCDGFDKHPRIFFTKRAAQNARSAWAQGVHRVKHVVTHDFEGMPDDYEDRYYDAPPFVRAIEDLTIIECLLSGLM